MAEGEGKQATGEKKARKPWTLKEFGGKTVWDWMQLLIVPVALAVIGFAFTVQQDARQQAIEDQRAEAERELAEQRAQDEALQAYLDQMNNLLLEHNLRNSQEDSGVRTLARARTLTVLGRLDPSRKTAVMKFLVDAELIQSRGEEPRLIIEGPIIDLSGADLSEADLRLLNLSNADLIDADLRGADLYGAYLLAANLGGADLRGANLSAANLSAANLNLANLSGADLREAYLSNAFLSEVDLSGADLRGANLSGADLSEAKGTTKEQLEQAKSLEGATMPDGSKHP
jgi:uncharacterized protein YjbI with pentapeptide repeats